MYNGIGLPTARGSGTNGYVQRNWAAVRKTKDKVNYKTEEELEKLDASNNKQPNKEILDHERKRKVEVKCIELEEILEEKGYAKTEIDNQVTLYRHMLMESDGKLDQIPKDEYGRFFVRETHQIAEAQQEKNAKLREAFGISEFFVEGSSLDPQRHVKEAAARAAAASDQKSLVAQPKYSLVKTPSPSPIPDSTQRKRKHNDRDRSSSTEAKKRRKKSKRNKKERSDSVKQAEKKNQSTSKEQKKPKSKTYSRNSSSSSDNSSSSDSRSSSDESSYKDQKNRQKKKEVKTKSGPNKVSEKPRGQSRMMRVQTDSDSLNDSSTDSRNHRTERCQQVLNNKPTLDKYQEENKKRRARSVSSKEKKNKKKQDKKKKKNKKKKKYPPIYTPAPGVAVKKRSNSVTSLNKSPKTTSPSKHTKEQPRRSSSSNSDRSNSRRQRNRSIPSDSSHRNSGRGYNESPAMRYYRYPDRRNDQSPGRRNDQSPGRRYDQSPGRRYDQSPGRRYDQSPGRRYDQSPGRRYDQSPGRRYDQSPGRRYDQYPGRRNDQSRSPGRRYDQSPGRRYDQYPGRRYDQSRFPSRMDDRMGDRRNFYPQRRDRSRSFNDRFDRRRRGPVDGNQIDRTQYRRNEADGNRFHRNPMNRKEADGNQIVGRTRGDIDGNRVDEDDDDVDSWVKETKWRSLDNGLQRETVVEDHNQREFHKQVMARQREKRRKRLEKESALKLQNENNPATNLKEGKKETSQNKKHKKKIKTVWVNPEWRDSLDVSGGIYPNPPPKLKNKLKYKKWVHPDDADWGRMTGKKKGRSRKRSSSEKSHQETEEKSEESLSNSKEKHPEPPTEKNTKKSKQKRSISPKLRTKSVYNEETKQMNLHQETKSFIGKKNKCKSPDNLKQTHSLSPKNHAKRSVSEGNIAKPSRKSSSSEVSNLSYSPAERNPEHYSDILARPIVHLHASSSEDEATEVKEKYDDDDEKEKEIRTLRILQSDLAAKAKESIEKKLPKTISVQTADKNNPDRTPERVQFNSVYTSGNDNTKSHTPISSPPKEISPMLERYLATVTPPYPDEGLIVTDNLQPPSTDKTVLPSLNVQVLASSTVKSDRPLRRKKRNTSESSNSSLDQKSHKSGSPTVDKAALSPLDIEVLASPKVRRENYNTHRRANNYLSSESKSRSSRSISSSSSSSSRHSRKSSSSSTHSSSNSSGSRKVRSITPRSRSPSESVKKSASRSMSGSPKEHHSLSSRSRSHSRSRRSSNTHSQSHSHSGSSSVSSRTRSPSIPRRRGSPSFLDRRRITSSKVVSKTRRHTSTDSRSSKSSAVE